MSEHVSHYSAISIAAYATARLDRYFFLYLMAERENQAADTRGQQGGTSVQAQQDAPSTSQPRIEVTLESLKTVMRCVAKEVFEEGRSQQQQQQQPESVRSGGTMGKCGL